MATFLELIWLLPLLPLVGFALNLFLVRSERVAGWLASALVGAAFVLTVAFSSQLVGWPEGQPYPDVVLFTWMQLGSLSIPFGLLFDPLTAVMCLLITGIGTLIHIYSIGYMHGDARATRYFAYLNLFVVMMLMLVMADNYALMFLGWEGVGLCSYLLIGYWFERKEASNASVKAFVVNRIGDACLLLALFAIFATFGTLNYYTQASGGELVAGVLDRADEIVGRTVEAGFFGPLLLATAIGLLMLAAVAGKSAQLPLFVWLPDAMAGPTPVSALIHAATMVTAGVYLLVRSHELIGPLQSPAVANLTVYVGALTALIGALAATTQWDIKRVLAYSTVSQLGFMVAAAGAGVYVAAMFHLLTHGIFKALLFLGAGSVIHGTHDTQDMRRMGGLRQKMPTTYWTYLVGALALAGIIPLAGFWSKDEILNAVVQRNYFPALIILFLTSLLTAFYMGRQIALVFFGKPRSEAAQKAHESGPVMRVPLIVLAVGAILGGIINLPSFAPDLPGTHLLGDWLKPTLEEEALPFGAAQIVLALVTTLASAATGYAGYRFYLGNSARIKPGERNVRDPLYPVTGDLWELSSEALGFNGLARYVRQGYTWLGARLASFDARGLDGLVDAVGYGLRGLGNNLRGAQTGYVRNYALLFLLGVVVIVGYFLLAGTPGLTLGAR
jgi:NADH-quinone oxidoreductase subunit L